MKSCETDALGVAAERVDEAVLQVTAGAVEPHDMAVLDGAADADMDHVGA